MRPLCWPTLEVAVQRVYSDSKPRKASGQRLCAVRATRKRVAVDEHTTSCHICVHELHRSHTGITSNGQIFGCHTSKVNFATFPA